MRNCRFASLSSDSVRLCKGEEVRSLRQILLTGFLDERRCVPLIDSVWISRQRRCVPFFGFCVDMWRRVVVLVITWCFTPSQPLRLYQENVEERRCVPFIRFCVDL